MKSRRKGKNIYKKGRKRTRPWRAGGILKTHDNSNKPLKKVTLKKVTLKKVTFADDSYKNSNRQINVSEYDDFEKKTNDQWATDLAKFNQMRNPNMITRIINWCSIGRDDPNLALTVSEKSMYDFLLKKKRKENISVIMMALLTAMQQVIDNGQAQQVICEL